MAFAEEHGRAASQRIKTSGVASGDSTSKNKTKKKPHGGVGLKGRIQNKVLETKVLTGAGLGSGEYRALEGDTRSRGRTQRRSVLRVR